jgi:hypothetical protein
MCCPALGSRIRWNRTCSKPTGGFLFQSTVGSHEDTARGQNGTLHWMLFLLPRMRKTVTPEPVLASQRDSNPLCRRLEHWIRSTGLSRLRPCPLRRSLSHGRVPPAKGRGSASETGFMHSLRRVLPGLSSECGVHGFGHRAARRVHPLRTMCGFLSP